MEKHQIGIECKSCHKQWRLTIPLTGSPVEVFASVCECGALIVGNYNTQIQSQEKGTKIMGTSISVDEKYLSNGQFIILNLDQHELSNLPELLLE